MRRLFRAVATLAFVAAACAEFAPASEPSASVPSDASVDGGGETDGASSESASNDSGIPGVAIVGRWHLDGIGAPSGVDSSGRGHALDLVAGAQIGIGGYGGSAACLKLDGAGSARATSLDGNGFPRTGALSFWFRHAFPKEDVATTNASIFDNTDGNRHHLFSAERTGRLPIASSTRAKKEMRATRASSSRRIRPLLPARGRTSSSCGAKPERARSAMASN